ncbi:unnamed protein product [Cuscuta epithymum]|uniref:CP12 domain-containing protein n=1 Tax=Cuscuta epithymum TaxID=186058 RepID=A0AAV0CSM6_9ASTE|nr:unnamed protein product [Cuscuta epithymum]
MATMTTGINLTAAHSASAMAAWRSAKPQPVQLACLNNNHFPKGMSIGCGAGRVRVRPVAAASDGLSEKVAESVKNAEETCAGDPESGECVAAWDEVEELSAAASHARERQKANNPSDPLEKKNYFDGNNKPKTEGD